MFLLKFNSFSLFMKKKNYFSIMDIIRIVSHKQNNKIITLNISILNYIIVKFKKALKINKHKKKC